jgi:hypothetical protein
MRPAARWFWIASALSIGACTDVTVENTAPQVDVDDNAAIPRGLYVITPNVDSESDTELGWSAAPIHRVIYLNKDGGTYVPGNNNSSTNRSSIPSQTSAVGAYEGTATQWTQLYTCLRDQFARFDVEVTDVDPGAAVHIEAVMGGNPQDVGMGSGVGGTTARSSSDRSSSSSRACSDRRRSNARSPRRRSGTRSAWITSTCARTR